VLTQAKHLTRDMCVLSVSGTEKVVSVSIEYGKGVYSIVTGEEMVVVGNIIASPYAYSHALPHYLFNLHRLLYTVSPSLMKSEWFQKIQQVFLFQILEPLGKFFIADLGAAADAQLGSTIQDRFRMESLL